MTNNALRLDNWEVTSSYDYGDTTDGIMASGDLPGVAPTQDQQVDREPSATPQSFLARLRRMVDGQHHHVSPRYLHQYASHAAWMEDHRRLDNGGLTHRALNLALTHPVSREWKGYWQRNRAN